MAIKFLCAITCSKICIVETAYRSLLIFPGGIRLEIKQAPEGLHHVPGVVEAKVENTKQVWEVLRVGSNARAVGSNNVNEHSSRSHWLVRSCSFVCVFVFSYCCSLL